MTVILPVYAAIKKVYKEYTHKTMHALWNNLYYMMTLNISFLMLILVDSIYQIPKGLQDILVLKVTEKEIQVTFQNLNTLPTQTINSIIVSRDEGGIID